VCPSRPVVSTLKENLHCSCVCAGTIYRLDVDNPSSAPVMVAQGVRNSVGLEHHPDTKVSLEWLCLPACSVQCVLALPERVQCVLAVPEHVQCVLAVPER
jgi:hypothetical protein